MSFVSTDNARDQERNPGTKTRKKRKIQGPRKQRFRDQKSLKKADSGTKKLGSGTIKSVHGPRKNGSKDQKKASRDQNKQNPGTKN